jgi:hypothetical protein
MGTSSRTAKGTGTARQMILRPPSQNQFGGSALIRIIQRHQEIPMAAEVILRSGWAEQRITSSDDESAPAHNEADADAESCPTSIQTTNAELRLYRVDNVPPTGRYFFVIAWPERFLLMRSTSAALIADRLDYEGFGRLGLETRPASGSLIRTCVRRSERIFARCGNGTTGASASRDLPNYRRARARPRALHEVRRQGRRGQCPAAARDAFVIRQAPDR